MFLVTQSTINYILLGNIRDRLGVPSPNSNRVPASLSVIPKETSGHQTFGDVLILLNAFWQPSSPLAKLAEMKFPKKFSGETL